MSVSNIDRLINVLKKCELIKEKEAKSLCEMAKSILTKDPNVIKVSAPVCICGDIHGQFYDLVELFKVGGEIPSKNYIFMGDYVDRGFFSVETFFFLLALKVRYPNRITLLRGNHESRSITQIYGFYDECLRKFGSVNVWKHCTDVFDYLPLAAIVDKKIFCVHGGISPSEHTIQGINKLSRKQEIPHNGGMCDLLWSDPEIIDGFESSPRGAGFLFGQDVLHEFCNSNGIDLVCRAHQLAMEGFKYYFDEKLVTVWSAPNYCYRCGNLGSILVIEENLTQKWLTFDAAPQDSRGYNSGNNKIVKIKQVNYFI